MILPDVTPPHRARDALLKGPPVDDVPSAFAELFTQSFAQRIGERFVAFLSGGPTARACYERVAAMGPGAVEWPLVDLYMGDERLVPPDDPDANQRMVREALVEPVGGVGAFTPMPTTDDPDSCAAAYGEVVARLIEGPGIDLVHLGLGPDGHTASLFPGADTLDVPETVLVAATSDPNGNNSHRRLSLTLPAIAAARLAVFTVAGVAKHDALVRVRSGDDLPPTRVTAGDVRWLVDSAAWNGGDER